LVGAFFWLIVGLVILIGQAATGTPWGYVTLFNVAFSSGWLALLLSVYNIVRWYNIRSYRRQRKEVEELWQRRQREHRAAERAERHEEPNPAFDFTNRSSSEPDEPPPAPPQGE